MAGEILNKARGREMATGYILVFFMDGFYQFVVLYLMGAVVPVHSLNITLRRGYGVRNTLTLDSARQSPDHLLQPRIGMISLPIANFLIIGLLRLFIIWFRRAKLGQDVRAVGQDQAVAHAAGIPVDRTRIIAIVISTILARLGQIILIRP
ncbi:MAG: hypothetical protein LBG43_00865 [Treponema sp.]|nr:hypothetical protein [Treponema sp.]